MSHLEAMLGLCSANCDCIGQLGAPLLVFEGYVGKFGGYVGPFGGHVGPCGGAWFSILWLCCRFLEAMSGYLEATLGLCSATCGSLCWNSVGQLWALLAASEGYVGPFGGYVATMLGSWGSAGCF